jgi:hypothetical protein
MADIFDIAQQKLTAAYVAGDPNMAGQPPSAIPILGIITVIMDIVKSLLASCPAPAPAIKAQAAAPTVGTLFAVRVHVRRELRDRYGIGGYMQHNGDRIVQTIMRAGNDATAEEIDQLAQA